MIAGTRLRGPRRSFFGNGGIGSHGKGKRVALLERGDVVNRFNAARADLEKVEFEHGDGISNKLGKGPLHIGAQGRVHRVMKNMRHLRRDFGKMRIAITARGAREGVRRNV